MYTAIIVVCAVVGSGYGNHCFELKDNWGPYSLLSECKARTVEMSKMSLDVFSNHKFPYEAKSWRCDYDAEGAA